MERIKIFFSVVLIFGLLGLPNNSEAALSVDFTSVTNRPLLKSKIGFARSFTANALPESILAMQYLKPAMLCSQVDFDSTTTNYAMDSNPILSDGTVAPPAVNDWLLKLENNLEAQHMKMMFSLTGQPFIQYERTPAREAAGVHPTPGDINASATAMANWAEAYFSARGDFPMHWSVWTEPGHTLTGSGTLEAAQATMALYLAYFQKLDPKSKYDTFSLASFIANDVNTVWEGEPFLNKTFRNYAQCKVDNPGLRLDYVTFNNYFGDTVNLLSESRRQITTTNSGLVNTPYVITQYAPLKVTQNIGDALGLTPAQEAVEEIGGLSDLLDEVDVEHVCFAWWLQNFLAWSGVGNLPSTDADPKFTPSYQVLKLYTQMPTWRATQSGALPAGVESMSSVDENSAAIMLWYDGTSSINVPLTFNLSWVPAKITSYKINNSATLPIVTALTEIPNAVDFLEPGIIMIKFDKTNVTTSENEYLANTKLVRTFSFADRKDVAGDFVLTGSYGNYDAQRSTAYVGATPTGRGIAGVRYYGLPDSLSVDVLLDNNKIVANQSATIGLRVDYLDAQGAPAKTMFFGRNGTNSTSSFPWGSTLPNYVSSEPNNYQNTNFAQPYILNLAQEAPLNWTMGERDAIISFVVENSADEIQARFQLASTEAPDAPSGLNVE